MTKTVTVVHCWSAPRSRSTALLYSFEARGADDCVAIDEPLYREWLIERGDSVARPYTQQMIKGIPPEDSPEEAPVWERELKSLTERIQEGAEKVVDGGVIFCKHMAKHCHLYDFENECSASSPDITLVHKHLLLIRDPMLVLSSWSYSSEVHGNNPTPDEVGIVPMLSIYANLQSRGGQKVLPKDDSAFGSVVLLDSDELAADPEGTLSNTCKDLGISYKESMITWEAGPHACDGPWAKVRKKIGRELEVVWSGNIATCGPVGSVAGIRSSLVVVPKCTQVEWLAQGDHRIQKLLSTNSSISDTPP
jgi:protein-lysine N-methyltransferase EEF2KMT